MFAGVHAERLLINVSAHMTALGYELGGVRFSETQLMERVLRPIISAFRETGHRDEASPVAFLFNSCDSNAATWNNILQQEPPATQFDAVVMTNPVCIDDIPHVLAGFARGWTNRVSLTTPGFTSVTA